MKKTVFVSAVLLLAACSPDTRHTDPAADAQIRCQHAAVLPDIRDTIRQTMRGEAQRFAAADNRDYVDADKVTAAADRLQVRMDGVRPDGKGCAAHISVVIPQTVLDTAENNAPLLNAASPAETILLRTADNDLRFDGQAVLAQLRYTVSEQPFAVSYADGVPGQIGTLLATALLPYGVKDIIMKDGRPVSREEALQGLSRPAMEIPTVRVPEETDTLAERRRKEQQRRAEEAAAETPAEPVRNDNANFAPAPAPADNTPIVDEVQLEETRNQHQSADRDIKSAWNRIDPSIQKGLVEEQRDWEKQKNRRCRQAAAKGGDESENQQLYMQCDTGETRKRIRYLDGYSIE